MLRPLRGSDNRTRFLWDCQWLVLRAEMNWDRWGFIHENLSVCNKYFEKKPIWVRAFRIWRLLHQMAGFTGHPDVIRARNKWRAKMKELDKGRLSDIEASQDFTSHLQMGLSAGELRRLRKMCVHRPNWRFNANASKLHKQVKARL